LIFAGDSFEFSHGVDIVPSVDQSQTVLIRLVFGFDGKGEFGRLCR